MQLFNTHIIPSAEDELWSLQDTLPAIANSRLVIISTPFSEGSAEETTLLKMMGACKLNEGEFVVIQLPAEKRISWQLLSAGGDADTVLLLGIAPAQLGISALFLLNATNLFLGCTFIPSADLAQIEADKELKRALWERGLKPCFGAIK